MLASANKYIGKCFKYLTINDKSFRRLIVNMRPDDGSLTVDYLVDILTPGSAEDLLSPVTAGIFSESFIARVTESATERATVLINILQMHYWEYLTEIVREKKNWNAVSLTAAVLSNKSKNSEMVYYILVELYVRLSVMRTIGDHADLSIVYEDIENYGSSKHSKH